MREIKNQANIARIVEGYRSTGHDIGSAISDLVDNSISHGKATKIWVDIDIAFNGDVEVSVVDNGIGMSVDVLENALKYGSDGSYEDNSLGKYGLGLKTASTAFCKKLVVLTRKKGADTEMGFNDLDLMAEKNDFVSRIADKKSEIEKLDLEILNDYVGENQSGTAIIWKNVDRLLTYKNMQGSHASRGLVNMRSECKTVCSVLFHKFLDSSFKAAEDIDIFVNEEQVEPWDPYLKPYSDVLAEEPFSIKDADDQDLGYFELRGYLIPFKSDSELPADCEKTFLPAGEKSKVDHQGFYVYRNHRIIYFGDWLKTASKEPHANYGRLELNFDETLDQYFNLDFSKRNVELNADIYSEVNKVAQLVRVASRQFSKDKSKKEANKKANRDDSHHTTSNRNIKKHAPKVEGKDTIIDTTGQDAENTATLTNKKGTTTGIKIGVSKPSNPKHEKVILGQGLENGNLWEPHLIPRKDGPGGIRGVRLNTDHDFYQKVYDANRENLELVHALDNVFFALAIVEHEVCNERSRDDLEEFREDVSRDLRRLVRDLPEPTDDD